MSKAYTYTFSLTREQQLKADLWTEEQKRLLAEKQSQEPELVKKHPEVLDGIPYTGAIGGLFSYTFTPTGLGVIIKIVNVLTRECLDLTDYNDW